MADYTTLRNPGICPLSQIPILSMDSLITKLSDMAQTGCVPMLLFGMPASAAGQGSSDNILLIAAMGDSEAREIRLLGALAKRGQTYESLTPQHPAFHLMERELFEEFHIRPLNHPWLKPLRKNTSEAVVCGQKNTAPYEFLMSQSHHTHQIGVGPVHAGVIEPGHFRFQCHGENVIHLEIQLGYQHRGMEEIMRSSSSETLVRKAESIAGDSCIAHSWACAMVLEGLMGLKVNESSELLRTIALEMERAAIHLGDLGALGGDVGFMMAPSIFADVRTNVINSTLQLCGSRFGRGLIRAGGVATLPGRDCLEQVRQRLRIYSLKAKRTCEIIFESAGLLARYENTGVVPRDLARDLGMVGPAARASDLSRDVRLDHPWGHYRELERELFQHESFTPRGDVLSRALIRYHEITTSLSLADRLLGRLESYCEASHTGSEEVSDSYSYVPAETLPAAAPLSLSMGITEGWRGETLHCGITDSKGNLARYKIKDPSFHNWHGLAMAVRRNGISDFPLCNKSFNLSYCGHDL